MEGMYSLTCYTDPADLTKIGVSFSYINKSLDSFDFVNFYLHLVSSTTLMHVI